MASQQTQQILPITLLVLVTAGIIGTFVLMRPKAFINDTNVLAQNNQQPTVSAPP